MEETQSQQPIDLRQVLRPVKARLWLIVVCVAVATGLTYYHYSSQPKQYRATTSLYLGSTDPGQLVAQGGSDRTTTDLANLVNTPAVARIAAKALGFKGNPDALLGTVSASPSTGSDFIDLSAVSGSGQQAAALVNAFADAFVTSRTQAIRAQARSAIQQAERQLAAIPNTLANATARGQLAASIQQMQNVETLPSAGIRHANPAFPPGAPFAPNPKQNAIFAFVIALLVSIGGAYALDRLDRRIRKLGDLEQLYGYPVLATVPRTRKPSPSDDGVALLPNDIRESFRKLCLNLQLSTLSERPRTIVVTSAVPREGKSTVTRNLALAFREAGLRVCVVDADLRRPGLSKLFDISNAPGLADVVVGDKKLTDALSIAPAGVPGMRTLARLQDPTAEVPASSIGSLVVLPSGPQPANPAVLLGSDQMRSVLSMLAEDFDVVLIDTSPLLAVSDAVPLLSLADGVVIVSRLALTTRDAAEKLVEDIRRIPGASLLGVVANDVSGRDSGYKDYSYGYARTTSA